MSKQYTPLPLPGWPGLSRIVSIKLGSANAAVNVTSVLVFRDFSCIPTSAICALDDSVFKAIEAMGDGKSLWGMPIL